MPYAVTLDSDNALVSLEEAKQFINKDLNDQTEDNKILQYINSASSLCNSLTHRKLKARDLTEYYSGDGSNTLMLNNYPINSIASIYDDLDRTYGADTLIDNSDYVIMPTNLAFKVIYDGSVFMKGIRNIKITYNAGYSTIPWDLREACLELVGFYWMNTEEKRFGILSINLGDGSVRIDTTQIPKSVLQILEAYRRKW